MLQIRLLGQFDIRLDRKRITIPSRVGQSLFAYLTLTAGTPHRRERLAGLFWPDTSDDVARKYLRQELWRIRKVLSAQQNDGEEYLLADEFTIAFNRNAAYWLDVAQLERPDLDLESLTSNLSLVQGELLPGFYENWIVLERERIQSIFDSKMGQLLDLLVASNRWTAVQEQAERWLAVGNAPEPAFRALMLAYGARGDMTKVSSVYQRCISELKEQYGLEPSAETRALYDGLLKGANVPGRPTLHPSGTVTFLFTDIEGSTNLLDKLGDQYAEVLATHHKIMRNAIQKWNGREVDTQGDAFFVTFARAIDAVQCAADMQRALHSQREADDKFPRVRMGLHTGEPLIAATGYVGMDVHRAARIGDAAHGGQVLLSQTTRELVMHELPKAITIRDLGEHRLKDLKFPTPIYQLVIEGLAFDFPPVRTKFSGTEAPTPGEPPFKGLQYFDEVDCDLFFGREVLTAKLIDRLRGSNFLSVIIGASGSGKSSLVRAGLIPALKNGQALIDGLMPPEGSTAWQIHIITPTAHPLEALATEMTEASNSVTTATAWMEDLTQDPRTLAHLLEKQARMRHTLLVVDQFEELFTLCRDEFEREAFIDNLLTALAQKSDRFTLVLTLRADFYAHLAQYPELRDAVARQQEYIGPMSMEELRRAIEEPAKRGHWAFEPGLVDLILRDIGDEPGALPLLSHALLETWKRRAGHVLTLKGYAEAGGVHGAIAHTAESVYQNLTPEEQTIAHDLFLRLTELGEGTEDTRRRASFDELMSDADAETAGEVRRVLNMLADARLLTLNEDTAEVAHEALIREWPTLREWLNQDRQGLQLHRRLTEAAHEWELLERDPGVLFRGTQLAQAREWAALHPSTLNAGEKSFLEASNSLAQNEIAEREAQQKRELEAARKLAETERQSASRMRVRNRVITIVGVVALALAVLASVFGLQSNQNALQAETNLTLADQQRAAALNSQSTAVSESQVRATQQAIAEANFKQAEAQRLAAEANRLLLGGGNPELIALLSLRSINTQYTPQGDSALVAASRLDYPEQIIVGSTEAYALTISPDGKYLVVSGRDGIVHLYEVKTGREIRQLVGHTDAVFNATFSRDGKYIVTGSADKTARVWDVATGQEVRKFTWELDTLAGVGFSPDGKYVLSGAPARIWEIATGQEVHRFVPQSGTVQSETFSHDGRSVLTGNDDGSVELWDAQTGRELQHFTGHKSSVIQLRFSPDDKFVLTGSADETMRLWDAATGQELQRFTLPNIVNSVSFSPDGKIVATASNDGTARVWDRMTGQEVARFPCPASVTDVVFSPDGTSIWAVSTDGITRLWNITPKGELPVFQTGNVVNGLAFSPDGKLILTGSDEGAGGVAKLWNASTGQLLREFIGHTDVINYGVTFFPGGKKVVTSSWDNTVRIWDIGTGKELYRFTGHTGNVHGVAFSPDGKLLLSAGDDGARLWDPDTGQQVLQLSDGAVIFRAVFTPDGKYIATARGGGSPDGAALWDANTGKLLHRFTGTAAISDVTFSPDGKDLLSSDFDGSAWLWDVQTGKLVHQFVLGNSDVVPTAIFSPDGKYVATASYDFTVRLWDAQTGQELRRLTDRTPFENVVFSPDGKYILTGGDDGTARLWDLDYHTTMKYLCSHLRDFTDEERTQYNIKDDTPTCPAK